MAKLKAVNYRLIDPISGGGKALYSVLRELIDEHHAELTEARFALAWNLSLRLVAELRA